MPPETGVAPSAITCPTPAPTPAARPRGQGAGAILAVRSSMALPRRPTALIAGAAAIGMMALVTLWRPDPFLLNTTPSMPVGLYQRASAPVALGAVVSAASKAQAIADWMAARQERHDPP